jgi:hypothetical protein
MAARGGLGKMERAVLTALLGKADGHRPTVGRRQANQSMAVVPFVFHALGSKTTLLSAGG